MNVVVDRLPRGFNAGDGARDASGRQIFRGVVVATFDEQARVPTMRCFDR